MYQAIDVHGHLGDPSCFPQRGLEKEFYRLSLKKLKEIYDASNVTAACLSPMEAIFPADEQVLLDANSRLEELSMENEWLYQWVVVDPKFPASYNQAECILKSRKCVGVKIHSDAHGYPIEDFADEVFALCSAADTVLEAHSGDKMSLPENMVPFADKYPNVKLIASHLGCGYDGCIEHQVRAIQVAKYGNIYTDVSSVRSILNNLIEWAVQQVTCGKLLFGTDTPLHHIPMMKHRVETADITEHEKESILYRNACELFREVFEK